MKDYAGEPRINRSDFKIIYSSHINWTQFQNPVMKISVTPLHKIYNSILI